MTVRIELTPSTERAINTVCQATVGGRGLEVEVNGRSGRLSWQWFDGTAYALVAPRYPFARKYLGVEKAGQEIGVARLKWKPLRAFFRCALADFEWKFQNQIYRGRVYPCRVDIRADTGERFLAARPTGNSSWKPVFVCRGSADSPQMPFLFAMALTLAIQGLLDRD